MVPRSVLIEADGGSRGNPGPAAYGAVLLDADTREVIAERAEYHRRRDQQRRGVPRPDRRPRALPASTRPTRELEVRMDSKLVVEQMSGRWKIKHPDMRPLADAGQRAGAGRDDVHLDPARAEQARRPDPQRGAGRAGGRPARAAGLAARADVRPGRPVRPADRRAARLVRGRHRHDAGAGPARRHRAHPGQAVLQRAGRQQPRSDRGGPGADPGHRPTGWPRSPTRSTRSSPRRCGAPASPPRSSPSGWTRRWSSSDGLAEMEFGTWDGMTFAEIQERHPDDLDALARLPRPRARRAASRSGSWRSGCWPASSGCSPEYAGQTVLAVSHVTPIKVLVAHALGAPLEAVYRMEMAPGVGDGAVLTSTGSDGRERLAADVQRAPDRRRLHRSLTTTSSRLPCRPARTLLDLPAERPQVVGEPGRGARRRAVLQQRAHDPALGRLVEVRDDLARARPPRAAPASSRPCGPGPGPGRQNDAYVDERRSTTRPRPAASRTLASSRLLQYVDTVPSPGQGHVTRQPVGRHPVGRAQQPEQARGHREPGRRPPPRRAASAIARSSAS